jgi:hypothetical protein
MKSRFQLLRILFTGVFTFATTLLPAAAADGFIYINVSVKFILFPGDGGRPRLNPADVNSRVTDASIETALEDANSFLASYGRGYRIRIVETLEIGGLNQNHANQPRTKPGYYAIDSTTASPLTFSYPTGYTDPFGNPRTTGPLIDTLDQNARSNATTKADFKWNDNAVNIFVPSAWGGGGGIFPSFGNAAGFGYFEGWLFLHELGHYFDLYHTFGDDGVADTLVDPADSGRNSVAYALYGLPFSSLTAAQKTAVDKDSGVSYRAAVIYGKTYANLTAAEKAIVDNLPTAENWSQILYSKTYANLTASEKAEVDSRVSNPPFTTQDLEALSYRQYFKSYIYLSAAELSAVRTLYATRTRDSISAANGMGNSYASLSAFNQDRVNNVFNNLMSYYDPPMRNETTTRLTEGQCDRWTDTANSQRLFAVTGKTWFVQAGAPSSFLGTSSFPFNSLTNGVTAAGAAGNDILLLRPGTYTANTISKPLTIRATRQGAITVQKP